MVESDNSMTNAFMLVITLLGLDVLFSLLAVRSTKIDKLLNDAPLVLVENGQMLKDRMMKARVGEDDILEEARMLMGVERVDQIKYAVLERNGGISIIPK